MTGHGSSLSTPAALAAAGLWLGLWAGPAAAQVVADDVVCAGCVQASDIANGTIGPNKLIPGSINATTIANGVIGPNKLIPGSVNTATIANNAIRSNKILDGAVQTDDLADFAVTFGKIKPGAVAGDRLDSQILNLIDPTLTRITSAAFVPTGNDFSKFFNDRDGYLIPSNFTNSFCARAPIEVVPVGVVSQLDAFIYTASTGGALTVAVKSTRYAPGTPTAAVEHISEDLSGIAVLGIRRVELVANPILQIEQRTAYWVEVCITGDGLNARNLRFYAVEIFTEPRF